jgi:hypothetical protein
VTEKLKEQINRAVVDNDEEQIERIAVLFKNVGEQ